MLAAYSYSRAQSSQEFGRSAMIGRECNVKRQAQHCNRSQPRCRYHSAACSTLWLLVMLQIRGGQATHLCCSRCCFLRTARLIRRLWIPAQRSSALRTAYLRWCGCSRAIGLRWRIRWRCSQGSAFALEILAF
jgi:hypothetical protein